MASAGAITWDLVANSSKFVSELEKANKAGKNWGDKLGKAAKGVATTFAAAGAAAAASLAALYTVTAGNIDEQAKFADKIGLTTDALGGLHHAADLTGVSTENMNLGLQRMTRRVAEAAQGTGTAVDALEDLNLSAQELNQLSPDEQFLAIADAMGEVEGRSEQVRLAFKLFDSGGVALLNTMDMASDGIREAMEQAENLGIALNRIDAAKVENANDAFDIATKLSAGLSRQITVELAPIVEGLSVEFVRAANEAGGMGEVVTTAVDYMVKSVGVLADSWRGLEIIFQALKIVMYQLALDSIETIRMVEHEAKGMANSWRKLFGQELLTMNRTLTESSIQLRMELNDAHKAIINLSEEPLPSDTIQRYVHNWRQVAEAEATAAANAKVYNEHLEDLGDGDGDDEKLSFWEKLKEHIEETTNDFDAMWGKTFDRFTSNFGDAVGSAIVDGENFGDAMDKMALGFARSMISALTDIATKQLTLWAIQNTVLKTKQAGEIARVTGQGQAESQLAAVSAFKSTAAIPVVGPGMAPAAAAAALAFTQPMALAATSSASAALAGMAHSGMSEIPERGTWLLDRGERVLSAQQNTDLSEFLKNQSGQEPQISNSFTFVIEAGASQQEDENLAADLYDKFTARLISDGKTNGPVRRAMTGS